MDVLHVFENTTFAGIPFDRASQAMILVHGRGDSSDKMKQLALALELDKKLALAFPRATNNTWYPKGFMAPTAVNQPWLDSALQNLREVVGHLKSNGIAEQDIYLLGFSQGACLALEYATIHARKYAGLFILSGGLIGPEIDASKYQGDFQGTEILMGCSNIDHHIPMSRLEESKAMLTSMGAHLDYRIYPGMDHVINDDEMQKIKAIINRSS